MITTNEVEIPLTYDEALKGPFSAEWQAAMEIEIYSLKEKEVFIVVTKTSDMNVIKCKWVYAVKQDEFGNVIKFKARLTGKGYSQKHGIDFDDTYAPVSEYSTIRLFFVIVMTKEYSAFEWDITTAFLNSDLSFTIYMEQPPGFKNPNQNEVYQLFKLLYGLKQGAHDWNKTIHEHLNSYGFKRLYSDHCLYVHHDKDDHTILVIWVDDILIASNSLRRVEEVKKFIFDKFPGKDMGNIESNQYLKWKIRQSNSGIHISQKNAINELLQKFGMENSKRVNTPCDPQVVLGLNSEAPSKFEYRSCIGSLYHLVNCTRPDICYAVSYAARFQVKPSNTEITALKRILQYLNSTRDLELVYNKSETKTFNIVVYADASFAPQGEKSTSGWIIFVNDSCVVWKTLKQSITAKSSAEAEYIALTQAVSDAIYLRSILMELGY